MNKGKSFLKISPSGWDIVHPVLLYLAYLVHIHSLIFRSALHADFHDHSSVLHIKLLKSVTSQFLKLSSST